MNKLQTEVDKKYIDSLEEVSRELNTTIRERLVIDKDYYRYMSLFDEVLLAHVSHDVIEYSNYLKESYLLFIGEKEVK